MAVSASCSSRAVASDLPRASSRMRLIPLELARQLGQAAAVLLAECPGLGQRLARLHQVGLLLTARLARILDRFLETRYLRSNRVELPLDLIETIVGHGMVSALLFDLRLQIALIRNRRLQPVLLFGNDAITPVDIAEHLIQAQDQEFRTHLALLLAQRLVSLRGGGLALEMPELLLNLLAQIVQAFEVLARVPDPVLGLAPSLLVLGDPGRLFQVDAQVLRTRLNQARDHALLDDGVTARAETGTQKEIGDVASSAAHAVEKIARLTITRDLALDRDLAVLGILPAGAAIRRCRRSAQWSPYRPACGCSTR